MIQLKCLTKMPMILVYTDRLLQLIDEWFIENDTLSWVDYQMLEAQAKKEATIE